MFLQLWDSVVARKPRLLNLQPSPETLDEHMVHPTSLSINTHLDSVGFDFACPLLACELASLIRVEDLRPTSALKCVLQSSQTHPGIGSVTQFPA